MQVCEIAVPLHPVISFSVINYVVRWGASLEWRSSFFLYPHQSSCFVHKWALFVDATIRLSTLSAKMGLFVDTSIVFQWYFSKIVLAWLALARFVASFSWCVLCKSLGVSWLCVLPAAFWLQEDCLSDWKSVVCVARSVLMLGYEQGMSIGVVE